VRDLISTITNKTPVPLVGRGSAVASRYSGMLTGSDKRAQIRTTAVNGTLYGMVNTLTTSTAAVEWKLWRKAKSGKKEDRVQVTSHAALDVWNRPNGYFTQRLYVESVQQHVELAGLGWLLVYRVGNLPVELWFARPDRIRPIASTTEFIAGYIYRAPDGEQIPLDVKDVLPLRIPDPDNIYDGLSPIPSLLRTIDTQRLGEEWNRQFYANNARPGGVIEVEDRLGDDEFTEFQQRWAETHQGISNVQRVAILENGMKWVDTKYSMRDLQVAELADVGPDKIREAYGFFKFMSGRVDDVNRATAEASAAAFAQWLLVQRLDRWKDLLNWDYLPLFGSTTTALEFDYDNPVPPDAEAVDRERTSRSSAASAYVTAGYDGVETGTYLGLPDSMAKSWKKPEPKQLPVPPGQDPNQGEKPADTSPASLAGPWLNVRNQTDNDLQKVQDDWEAALAAVLSTWAGVTAAQRAELAAQIRALIDAGDIAGLADLTASSALGEQVLAAALQSMAATAAATAAAEAAAQGVTVTPPAVFGGDLALVAAAVAGLLAAGLATAAGKEALRLYQDGADGAEIARQVDAHLTGLSDAYLREQLGGALTRAQNVGRLETFKVAEAVNPQVQYSASETLDRNTCKPCRDIDGTVFDAWIDAWTAYAGGSYKLCLGGVRCRGTVVAAWIGAAA